MHVFCLPRKMCTPLLLCQNDFRIQTNLGLVGLSLLKMVVCSHRLIWLGTRFANLGRPPFEYLRLEFSLSANNVGVVMISILVRWMITCVNIHRLSLIIHQNKGYPSKSIVHFPIRNYTRRRTKRSLTEEIQALPKEGLLANLLDHVGIYQKD